MSFCLDLMDDSSSARWISSLFSPKTVHLGCFFFDKLSRFWVLSLSSIALMTFLSSFPALLKIVTTEIEHNIHPKGYTKVKYRQQYFFPGSIPISNLRISLVLLATRHAEISCSVENAHHLHKPFKVSISYHKYFNLLSMFSNFYPPKNTGLL